MEIVEKIAEIRSRFPNTLKDVKDENIVSLAKGINESTWGPKEVKEWAKTAWFPTGQCSFLLSDFRAILLTQPTAA